MKVIFGLGRAKIKRLQNLAVTLGIFDGLHRGHLRLLNQTIKCARRIKGKSLVVTFYPHPQSELQIYSLKHRLKLFNDLGIDICIVLKFTKYLSKIKPGEFIESILLKKINPAFILVGENFCFGRGARGNWQMLASFAQRGNFKLKVIPVAKFNNQPISSTYIRRLILDGELEQAQKILSRPVSIMGRVISGSRIGLGLGFPTANIKLDHEIIPPCGIYLARAYLNKKIKNGVCYIGKKPSLKNRPRPGRIYIEMHIFNFRGNLYGKRIEVQFLKKIREDRKFSSLELLAGQIKKDVEISKKFFRFKKSFPD